MTVGCGKCHINTGTFIVHSTTEVFTEGNPRKHNSYTYWYLNIHPHVYIILSTYAVYTTIKWMSHL
jgi:hypothetical protein